MPVILNAARPDCDYRDPKKIVIIAGQEGCPQQAQFKIWLQTKEGVYADKFIHACRGHASELFKSFLDMAKEMRRLGEKVKVQVVDITMTEDGSKKPVRVLVKRQDKGLDRRRLNSFLAKRR